MGWSLSFSIASPARMPAFQAGIPGRTSPIVEGGDGKPTWYEIRKNRSAVKTFIVTPAEIIAIR